MIRQTIDVKGYWKGVVYWNVDYPLFYVIEEEMREMGISEENIEEIYEMMSSGKAKAVTFSDTKNHISIVLFNRHKRKEDYINSIVHEAEHVKQAMLEAYQVEDKGEPPAYTIGYLVSRMWNVFKDLVCKICNYTRQDV